MTRSVLWDADGFQRSSGRQGSALFCRVRRLLCLDQDDDLVLSRRQPAPRAQQLSLKLLQLDVARDRPQRSDVPDLVDTSIWKRKNEPDIARWFQPRLIVGDVGITDLIALEL